MYANSDALGDAEYSKRETMRKIVLTTLHLFIIGSGLVLSQTNAKIDTLDFIDSTSCNLTIYANRTQAQVYIDSVYVGQAPFEMKDSLERCYSIKIFHPQYGVLKINVATMRGKNIVLSAFFSTNKGNLAIQCLPSEANVYIDSMVLPKDTSEHYLVSYGSHKIEIRSDSLKRSISSTILINPGERLAVRARLGYYSLASMIQSIVIPGCGQIRDGAILKGLFFTTGTIALILYSSNLNRQYQERRGSYNSVRNAYLHADTETDIVRLRKEMIDANGLANNSYKKRNITYTALIALYLANVADAFLFHNIDDEIQMSPNVSPAGVSVSDARCLQDFIFTVNIKL